MSNQVKLPADARTATGKGAAGRLRKEGRVPGILYGYQVEPTPVSVDARELFHALNTEAGANVLIRLEVDGETHLTVTRDMQRHPVRGDALHVDFLAVDRDTPISVEVPVHLTDEDETERDNGVVNQILYTVPILVKPLETPNFFELSLAGMAINDVKRVADLDLPEGAELDIDPDTTIVSITAPVTDEELEALEEAAGVETEEPDAPAEGDTEE